MRPNSPAKRHSGPVDAVAEDLETREAPREQVLVSTDQYLSRHLPTVFAVLCSVLGLFYVFTVPPLQVPDEFAHLYRAYGLSEGHFVAPPLTPIPASVVRLTSRFPPHLETVRRLRAAEIVALEHEALKPEEELLIPNEGMNVNTWIPYLPSAVVIFIARLSRASPITILYLGRLANLAGYIVLTWLALRLAPPCRLAIFTVGLMPMVLHQAAGLSWDSIGFGIALLFCAIVLRYACYVTSTLGRREYLAVLVSVVVVSLCKVDFALLPLLLLIPTARFGSLRRRIGFLMVCVAAAIVTSVIWQFENRVNLQLFAKMAATGQVRFPENIWYLYFNTGYLIDALIRTIIHLGPAIATQLVGTFGWLFVALPRWAVLMYLGVLLSAGITSLAELRLGWFQRGVVGCVALLGVGSCVLAMWLTTPDFYIRNVILHDIGTLYGIQGRHFIPFVFPGLLILSNTLLRVRFLWMFTLAVLVVLTVNTAAILLIEQSYY